MASPSPDDLLREGAARHRRGDLEGASRLYRKVLAVRPADGNALNLLGVAARQRGDLHAALDLSARALATMPTSPVFLANHGAALAEAGQFERAVPALRAALSLRGDDVVSLRNLGQALCGAGEARAALAPLGRATDLAPDQPEAWLALAHARREAGAEGAAEAAQRALACPAISPVLAAQARFLLAALGRGEAPDRAPATYVRDLFDQYAARFDADLEGRLAYRTPTLLADLLAAQGIAPDSSRRVLDLGCGTGLSGLALKPFAKRLVGVDLSPRMLAEARRRGIYQALDEADLMSWLPRHRSAFDLIVAADVLNYLGDLRPALAAVAGASVRGGVVAFSIEAGTRTPFELGPGLRYRHDPDHVAELAQASGLAAIARQAVVLREEQGAPVAGVLFVLRA
jgi:predicted TPR repeat methyltransferase